ncbi:CPBP family intramembrane glutamic endopeptidase [Flavobacterium silvaticum]|uniref:CPBP family intramembrane metalloprotease n=1 Tax=Flavobacterium silvaticum TaxID=1852020 RepID=A0A972JJ76_9FLAO|nr:CPBP family intramembrane glutamic endopeptidase [Flavobacterium silvaticum]NMH27927.1 CPBP family intramembrane metalloprotease [Flavobacterium silvaticum]
MKSKVNIPSIALFYIVAVALRYLTNKTEILDIVSNDYLRLILHGIGPAVGAIVVFIAFKIKPVMSLKGNYKKLIYPFVLYWMLPIVLICASAYFKDGSFPVMTVLSILIYGLLEEIGWRGFLQQELKPLPLLQNVLIVATLWFLWHLNFEFSTSNLVFFGILVLGSWGIGKVANTTNSLMAVSAFHSLNNFFGELNTIKTVILITLLAVWIIGLMYRKKQAAKAAERQLQQQNLL